MNNIGWASDENKENIRSGINNAGKENFKDSPLYHVPRELTQDSLDARDIEQDAPSRITFNVYRIKKSDIPQIDQLETILSDIIETWKYDIKTHNHFKKMLDKLERLEEIDILAVQDYNTTGLAGVKDPNGKWNSLIKGLGFSDKPAGSNGSRGLGKHAPFLASFLSTVFYGTVNKNGEKGFQGVSKLASYQSADGKKFRETVYYGEMNDFSARTEFEELHEIFQREEVGTDKFILGYNFNENWKFEFIKTITENFLLAIYERNLIVEVENVIISRETLPEIINDIMSVEPDHIVKQFYTALTTSEPLRKEIKIHDGSKQLIELHLIKGDEYKNSVSMNRGSGMQIFVKNNFKKPPTKFSGYMVIRGQRLNEILSEVETATHQGWHVSVDSYIDEEEKEELIRTSRIIKSINQWISKSVHELAPKPQGDIIELSGLEGILPNVGNDESVIKHLDYNSLEEKISTILQKEVPTLQGNEGRKRKKRKKSTDGKPKKSTNNNNNELGKSSKNKKTEISKFRSICLNEEKGLYKVILNSKSFGTVNIQLRGSGEDGRATGVPLSKVTKLITNENIKFEDNVIGPLDFGKDKRLDLLVTLEANTLYSLEVNTK